MKSSVVVGVWAYMVAAVVAEVAAFYYLRPPAIEAAVGVLAASQAVALALFYMELKYEPNSIRLFALIALMFLAALLIAMIASLG
jgi:hypothetical protein